MALNDEALKSKLLTLFISMKASPMSDADYAEKLAKIIDDQIKTATVSVSGVMPGSGAAAGAIT